MLCHWTKSNPDFAVKIWRNLLNLSNNHVLDHHFLSKCLSEALVEAGKGLQILMPFVIGIFIVNDIIEILTFRYEVNCP